MEVWRVGAELVGALRVAVFAPVCGVGCGLTRAMMMMMVDGVIWAICLCFFGCISLVLSRCDEPCMVGRDVFFCVGEANCNVAARIFLLWEVWAVSGSSQIIPVTCPLQVEMPRHVPTTEVKGNRAFGLGKGHKTQTMKAPRISQRKGVSHPELAHTHTRTPSTRPISSLISLHLPECAHPHVASHLAEYAILAVLYAFLACF